MSVDSAEYKVFFHPGEELGLKTKVSKGKAWLDDAGLHIKSDSEFLISKDHILQAELFRLHGLGRVIRLEHTQRRFFLSVVRFMIGQFATINFFKTGQLHKKLADIASLNESSRLAKNSP